MDSSSKLNFSAGLRTAMGTLLTCAMIMLAAPGVNAQPRDDLPGISRDTSSSYFGAAKPGIGIKRATAIARKHTGGRVLSASPRQAGQATLYRVRVLVGGERVVTVTVDQDGQIIRPD